MIEVPFSHPYFADTLSICFVAMWGIATKQIESVAVNIQKSPFGAQQKKLAPNSFQPRGCNVFSIRSLFHRLRLQKLHIGFYC